MTRQPDLFRPMLADVSARQGELFPDDGPADSALTCGVCGDTLTRTPSGYLACPRGHGKLLAEAVSKGALAADDALLDLLGLDRSLFAAPPPEGNPPPGSPPAVIPFTPLEEIGKAVQRYLDAAKWDEIAKKALEDGIARRQGRV